MNYTPGIYTTDTSNETVIIDGLWTIYIIPNNSPKLNETIAVWQKEANLERKGIIPYSWIMAQTKVKRFSA